MTLAFFQHHWTTKYHRIELFDKVKMANFMILSWDKHKNLLLFLSNNNYWEFHPFHPFISYSLMFGIKVPGHETQRSQAVSTILWPRHGHRTFFFSFFFWTWSLKDIIPPNSAIVYHSRKGWTALATISIQPSIDDGSIFIIAILLILLNTLREEKIIRNKGNFNTI